MGRFSSEQPLREKPYSLIISRPSNEVKDIMRAVQADPNLEELSITNVSGTLTLEGVFQGTYPTITKLGFMNCGIRSLPENLHSHFPNVQELVLSRNKIKKLPKEFGKFTCLHSFRINHADLQELPDSVGELSNLHHLNCAHNKLKTLPNTLAELRSLVRLDVRDNAIRTLPTTLSDLTRLNAFYLWGNPLVENLGSDKKEDVAVYLQGLREGVVENKEVKVAVVGEERAGKTTLIQALRENSEVCREDVEKTDGIGITSIQIEDITLRVFDTAGDVDFLETHLLFTSLNCLYLHVYNLAGLGFDVQAGVQLGRLEMWLKAIHAHAPESMNLIVGTHADSAKYGKHMAVATVKKLDGLLHKALSAHRERWKDNPEKDCLLCQVICSLGQSSSCADEGPSERVPTDTDSLEASIPHVLGRWEVSSVKRYPATLTSALFGGNPNMAKLKSSLAGSARKLLKDAPQTPKKWEDILRQWRWAARETSPVLHTDEARQIAKRFGVPEEAQFLLMLHFLSNTGQIIYHKDVPDTVVLNPQWLADQLRKFVSFKKEQWIFTEDDLRNEFGGTYDEPQKQIIQLFRHFRICFQLKDGSELFPGRLPVGMPSPPLWPDAPGKDARELSYMCEFSFVPNSLFTQIIVKIHGDSNVDKESPDPRFFGNRAIYQTRETPGGCSDCDFSPSRFRGQYHRVHIELRYQQNAVVVTVRGPSPCCIATSTRETIKSVAGENIVTRFHTLCPECFVGDVCGDMTRLQIVPREPGRHISCKKGHELGRQDGVVRGEFKCSSRPVSFQTPTNDEECPRFFVVLPINRDAGVFSQLLPHSLLGDGFAVHFLCEQPGDQHFLSSPGFRLRRLEDFMADEYGARAYRLMDIMFKTGPATPLKLFGEKKEERRDCQDAIGGLLRFFCEKCSDIKERSELVNLDERTPGEKLMVSQLKKHLGISNDSDQPGIPGLKSVRVKGKVLWLCYRHAKASLRHANQDSAPSIGVSGTFSKVCNKRVPVTANLVTLSVNVQRASSLLNGARFRFLVVDNTAVAFIPCDLYFLCADVYGLAFYFCRLKRRRRNDRAAVPRKVVTASYAPTKTFAKIKEQSSLIFIGLCLKLRALSGFCSGAS